MRSVLMAIVGIGLVLAVGCGKQDAAPVGGPAAAPAQPAAAAPAGDPNREDPWKASYDLRKDLHATVEANAADAAKLEAALGDWYAKNDAKLKDACAKMERFRQDGRTYSDLIRRYDSELQPEVEKTKVDLMTRVGQGIADFDQRQRVLRLIDSYGKRCYEAGAAK